MRILYLLRVILVSGEALVIAIALLTFIYFGTELEHFSVSLSLNEEVLKYLILMPTGLGVWTINEIRPLLQEDKESTRILTDWEDYWKLKTHTSVSFGYAVIFSLMSITPWTVKSGINTGIGLLLFVSSITGQLLLAITIYRARIRVKEIIAHLKSP